MKLIDKYFQLTARGTSVQTELWAGLTTFMAMSYVIFVVPSMLADTGMPREAVVSAVIWTSALTTLLMGLWVNLPIALAPGMGISAFFTYTVCLGMGLPWQTALGAVFVSGVAFFILTVTRLRQAIIAAIPECLRCSIGCGIGAFIAFIGLQKAGIVVGNVATLVTFGNILSFKTALSFVGILVTGVFMARNIKGAILLGIFVTTVLAMCTGHAPLPSNIQQIISFEIPSFSEIFLQLDVAGAIHYGLISVLFTITMVDLFDSIGTIIGLTRRAGLVSPDGVITGLDKSLITDSSGTVLSGLIGTPSVTAYIESAAGVAAGGRTGLTAVTTALLFLLSLLLAPLVKLVPDFATAPALVVVGALMMQDLKYIRFDDIAEGLPAFLVIVGIPLTYSISTGFGMGFGAYVIIKTFSGEARRISLTMWIITACFAVNFVMR